MNNNAQNNASARKLVMYSLRCCLVPLWHQPMRVAILGGSVAISYVVGGALSAVIYPASIQLMNFRSVAGSTLQIAAAVISPFVCTWAADMLIVDVRNHRLEMIVTAGRPAYLYILPKLLALLLFLFCGGLVAAVLSFCSLEASMRGLESVVNPFDYIEALLLVYMPTVILPCVMGVTLGAITRSQGFSVAAYLLLWSLSLMWSSGMLGSGMRIPEDLAAFDVTGESLELLYFEKPLMEEDMPREIGFSLWNMYVKHDEAVRHAAVKNPFFLIAIVSIMLLILSVRMWMQWHKSAGQLIAWEKKVLVREKKLPANWFGLKAIRPRMLALPLALSLAPMLLLSVTDTPSTIAHFSMYSLTPVLFSPIWSSCLLCDETAGTHEMEFCQPFYRKHCVVRILVPLVANILSLVIQYCFWSPFLKTNLPVSLLFGVTPVLFMGGAASLVASLSRRADVAGVMSIVLWTVLNLPPVRDFFTTLPEEGLYPFMAAYLIYESLPVSSLVAVLALASIMFVCSINHIADTF